MATADAFISVLSVGEIERRIARARRQSDPFSDQLRAWLNQILTVYADRMVADAAVCRRWGRL